MNESMAATKSNQQSAYDNLGSLLVAGSLVDFIIDKVNHIKYLEELEKKKIPFTLCKTLTQSLMICDLVRVGKDCKKDDEFITAEYQEANDEEPPGFAKDCQAPIEKITFKVAHPKLFLDTSQPSLTVNKIDTAVEKRPN